MSKWDASKLKSTKRTEPSVSLLERAIAGRAKDALNNSSQAHQDFIVRISTDELKRVLGSTRRTVIHSVSAATSSGGQPIEKTTGSLRLTNLGKEVLIYSRLELTPTKSETEQ